jgi:hypothetical protein
MVSLKALAHPRHVARLHTVVQVFQHSREEPFIPSASTVSCNLTHHGNSAIGHKQIEEAPSGHLTVVTFHKLEECHRSDLCDSWPPAASPAKGEPAPRLCVPFAFQMSASLYCPYSVTFQDCLLGAGPL